jgi:hypothetical protein
MAEAPLYPPAADRAPTYRLLHLSTFRQPSLVRLTEASGVWRALCKRTDGHGGYGAGKLVGTAECELSRPQAKQLGRLLERVGFWEMPSFEECQGLDGTQCILEGVRGGVYHVVDRWSPHGTPYAELVEFLLELCRGVGEPPPEPPKYVGSFAELAERFQAPPGESGSAE